MPLLPLSRLFPRGSLGWLIVLVTVTLAFGLNGVLLMQSAATGAGDPAHLLVYGREGYGISTVVMRSLFALFAIPVLVAFGSLMLKLLRTFGPRPEDSYVRWVATVQAGFMFYFLLMAGHTAIFGDRALLLRQMLPFYVPFMVLLALLVLAAATWVYRTAGPARESPPAARHMTGARAIVLFGLACAVIGSELAFLGPP